MANDSDAEEYGDEWEEQEASDDESDGHEQLSVHPLPTVERTQKNPIDSDELTKTIKANAAREPSRGVLSDNDTASDSGESGASASEHSVESAVAFPESVVRLHARRGDCGSSRELPTEAVRKVSPPPGPTEIDHIGVRAAAEAKRRLREYRQEQQESEERTKMEEAARSQQMKQVRRMYKSFNQSIGVADIPPDKRYTDAIRRIRVEKQQADAAVSEETGNRWYRRVKRHSRSAVGAGGYGSRVLDEARREHRRKLQLKANQRKEVQKKLEQLSLEAQRIAAKATRGYEKGSYILRAAPQKPSNKAKKHEDTAITHE